MEDYVSHEIVLNVNFWAYQHYSNFNRIKMKIPTIFKYFYDFDILDKDFLVKLSDKNEEIFEFFEKHCLYHKSNMEDMLQVCEQLFKWIKEESNDDSSDSSDDESDSGSSSSSDN